MRAITRGVLWKVMASLRPLPNYLKMYRKRSGLTQRELAQLLGCKYGSKVSRYERGERIPNFRTLLAYEAIFHVPLSELFAGRYERIAKDVRRRAQRLHKRLDAKPFTPAIKQKQEALADVMYPDQAQEAA